MLMKIIMEVTIVMIILINCHGGDDDTNKLHVTTYLLYVLHVRIVMVMKSYFPNIRPTGGTGSVNTCVK